MSIETINLNEFINLIHPIDKDEKSNTDHKETEINIKISAFKERLLQTKNKNIYEEQAITTKIIKEALPKIEEKKQSTYSAMDQNCNIYLHSTRN